MENALFWVKTRAEFDRFCVGSAIRLGSGQLFYRGMRRDGLVSEGALLGGFHSVCDFTIYKTSYSGCLN